MQLRNWFVCATLGLSLVAHAVDPAPTDVSMRDAVQAIINYQAFQKQSDTLARREELLEGAPGTIRMMDHGSTLNAIKDSVGSYITENVSADITRSLGVSSSRTGFLQQHSTYAGTNADVNFSKFINNTTISAEDEATAKTLIQSITNPVPEAKLNATNPADQIAQANNVINAGLSSVGMNSLHQMLALRKTDSTTGTSMMHVMEKEASWRLFDEEKQWMAELSVTPEAGLLREIAHMEAYRLYMEHQRYKQGERIEALLAAQNYMFTQLNNAQIKMSYVLDDLIKTMNANTDSMSKALDKASESIDKTADEMSQKAEDAQK